MTGQTTRNAARQIRVRDMTSGAVIFAWGRWVTIKDRRPREDSPKMRDRRPWWYEATVYEADGKTTSKIDLYDDHQGYPTR